MGLFSSVAGEAMAKEVIAIIDKHLEANQSIPEAKKVLNEVRAEVISLQELAASGWW